MMYKFFVKRFFDFSLSLIGLLIISPVFLIILIILFFANDGKPFFYQRRPGRNEKIFQVIKFKTMNDSKDVNGRLLPDAKRLTRIGKFVRKTSLDELPQLLNVMKGDMSLIGPRPLLVDYMPLYDKEQKRRHEVRPGITGWAQVNGRNAISWPLKFRFDIWYVDNLSLRLDLIIFYLTLKKVCSGEGISSKTTATMEKFKGNF